MKIASGLAMLEIPADIMGKPATIYPALLWDNAKAVLVDTGFPGQAAPIREAIGREGISPNSLDGIILTHQDIDHVGSLAAILAESPRPIEVMAHPEEKPYIQGDRLPVKLARLEASHASLPEAMQEIVQRMKNFYANFHPSVGRTLADGEELPVAGGVTVIYSPGHTPGHICLYHNQSRTLIAGDALGVEEGRLIRLAESTNLDQSLSLESLKKLTLFDIRAVICYHGGFYTTDVNRCLKELVRK